MRAFRNGNPVPNPANPGDRTKANRLRKAEKAGTITDIDRLWLDDYNEKKSQNKTSYGASRSARRVKFEMDESAESVGTGTAASTAAAAALAAREEGRRLDFLTSESVSALKEAVAVYKDVCLSLKERLEIIENAHVSMMETTRVSYLRSAQMEAELAAALRSGGGEDAESTQLLTQILTNHFGLGGRGPAGTTHTNGHTKTKG